jgi:5'(3')-deoxyribonucleotidase
MKTILLDVDGVILNLAGAVHTAAQKLLSRKLPPPEAWKSYDFREAMNLNKSEWEFTQKTLQRRNKIGYLTPFYPQAQAFTEHLGFDHRVIFATRPWRGFDHWVEARYSVLDHFLNRKNFSIVFTENKDDIKGDWLIDDLWSNLEKTPEKGILFCRPWNEKHENWAHFLARDYSEVIDIIETPVDVASTNAEVPHAQSREQKKPTRKQTPKAKRR